MWKVIDETNTFSYRGSLRHSGDLQASPLLPPPPVFQCPDADLRVFVVPLCPGVRTLVCARALEDAEKNNQKNPHKLEPQTVVLE